MRKYHDMSWDEEINVNISGDARWRRPKKTWITCVKKSHCEREVYIKKMTDD